MNSNYNSNSDKRFNDDDDDNNNNNNIIIMIIIVIIMVICSKLRDQYMRDFSALWQFYQREP